MVECQFFFEAAKKIFGANTFVRRFGEQKFGEIREVGDTNSKFAFYSLRQIFGEARQIVAKLGRFNDKKQICVYL